MVSKNKVSSNKEELQNVRMVADKFITNELYQMFVVDKALWIYILLAIGIMIYYILVGLLTVNIIFYYVMIFVGGAVALFMQMSRLRSNEHLKRFNIAQVGIIVLNVGIVLIPAILGITKGRFEFAFVMDTFLVAMWENLTFGIIIPFILMWMFRFARYKKKLELPIFIVVIILSSVMFAFAHWKAYDGNLLTIGYLFGIGLGLMGLCYMVSPSLSISLHILNNLLLYSK